MTYQEICKCEDLSILKCLHADCMARAIAEAFFGSQYSEYHRRQKMLDLEGERLNIEGCIKRLERKQKGDIRP